MSGKFIQNAINPMNAFTFKINNHELDIFIIVIRLNIHSRRRRRCKHITSIKHALDYISRSHVSLKNELMVAKNLETEVFGHR